MAKSRMDMPISGDMAIEYTRAVERINKQMQRLEKAAKGGRKVLNYAYKGARISIIELFGEYTPQGKIRTRFSRTLPKNVAEYQAVMNAIKDFYSKPTSTLKGFTQIYSKRAETISEKYGVSVTPDQLAKIFDTGLWDAIADTYGSETTMEMALEVQQKADEIKEKLKKGEAIEWSSTYKESFESIKGLNAVLEGYLKGNAGT